MENEEYQNKSKQFKEEEGEVEENKAPRRPTIIELIVDSVVVFGVVTTYILLGVYQGLWAEAWPLFFLVAVIPSIFEAIYYKDLNRFAYPALVMFVYFIINMWYPKGMWHPLWVIFITIPFYYTIVTIVKRIIEEKKK